MNSLLILLFSICGFIFLGNCFPYGKLFSKYQTRDDYYEDYYLRRIPKLKTSPEKIREFFINHLSWFPVDELRNDKNNEAGFDDSKRSVACTHYETYECCRKKTTTTPSPNCKCRQNLTTRIKHKFRNFTEEHHLKDWTEIKSQSSKNFHKVEGIIHETHFKEKFKNVTHPFRYRGCKHNNRSEPYFYDDFLYLGISTRIHPKGSKVEFITTSTLEPPTLEPRFAKHKHPKGSHEYKIQTTTGPIEMSLVYENPTSCSYPQQILPGTQQNPSDSQQIPSEALPIPPEPQPIPPDCDLGLSTNNGGSKTSFYQLNHKTPLSPASLSKSRKQSSGTQSFQLQLPESIPPFLVNPQSLPPGSLPSDSIQSNPNPDSNPDSNPDQDPNCNPDQDPNSNSNSNPEPEPEPEFDFQSSDSQTPDSQSPDSQSFDSQSFDSQSFDSQSPDSQSPDSQSPDSQSPDSQSPDSQSPDSQSSDSQSPDSQSPDSQSSDSQPCDSQPCDSQQYDSPQYDSQPPDTQQSDQQQPNTQPPYSQPPCSEQTNSMSPCSMPPDPASSDSMPPEEQPNEPEQTPEASPPTPEPEPQPGPSPSQFRHHHPFRHRSKGSPYKRTFLPQMHYSYPRKIKFVVDVPPSEKPSGRVARNANEKPHQANPEDTNNSTHVLETAGEMASDLAVRVSSLWHSVVGNHHTPDLKNIKFYLYTRRNVIKPELLKINFDLINRKVRENPKFVDVDCIELSPENIPEFERISDKNRQIIKSNYLNIKAPTKILIHGYTGSYKDSRMAKIKDAYLRSGRYNVIQVDWEELAAPPCYIRVTHQSKFVGETIAQFLDGLQLVGLNMSLLHLVGFSLGAQVAGFAGNNATLSPVCRITGLDPALPLFLHTEPSGHLDKADAKFVDIIHTCGGILAMLDPLGHVDFYPNGGTRQPGCEFSNLKCSHSRAPQYFAESVVSKKKFTGQLCYTWEDYVKGGCKNVTGTSFMGEPCSRKSVSGKYYLLTKSREPFVL